MCFIQALVFISLLCVSRLDICCAIFRSQSFKREREIVRKERERYRFSHTIVPIAFMHVESLFMHQRHINSLIRPNRDLRRARVYRDLRAR